MKPARLLDAVLASAGRAVTHTGQKQGGVVAESAVAPRNAIDINIASATQPVPVYRQTSPDCASSLPAPHRCRILALQTKGLLSLVPFQMPVVLFLI